MAIVFDAASNDSGDSTDSATFAHTCTGTNLLLTVGITSGFTHPNVTGVTYGGNVLTVLSSNVQTDVDQSVWYMTNPPKGANDIVVTWGANAWFAVGAVSYTGVSQSTPFGTGVVAKANDTDGNVDVTSGTGEVVIDFYSTYHTSGHTIADGAGQTERVNKTHGATSWDAGLGISEEAGAATVNMAWTHSAARDRINYGIPLKPATAGKSRSVKYFHDINDPGGRIYNELGSVVSPWELKPNNWIRVTGLFLPTSTKYASFTQDPELAYIEEVSFSIRGGLRIKTNRGEMTEVLLARAAGGKTL